MKFGVARNNIGLSTYVVDNVEHNLVGDQNHNRSMSADNVILAGLDMNREFADHLNLDFRWQATSTLRGSGPTGVDRGPYAYQPFGAIHAGGDQRQVSKTRLSTTLSFMEARLRTSVLPSSLRLQTPW